MLSQQSLFSVREEQEISTALLIFNQALEDFFSTADRKEFTQKSIAAFICRLAEHYATDEAFKALLPQNKQTHLLQRSLYETAAALGDETAAQHLSQPCEDKEQAETLFANLLNRAKQHSFADFIKHLKESSPTGQTPRDEVFIEYLRETAELGSTPTADLKLELEALSKSYSQSQTLRRLTKNYPAYRSWISAQVDAQNKHTELKKLAAKGPVSYLKDFMENHAIELDSELSEKNVRNKLFTQLLLALSEIAATLVFTKAVEALTLDSSSVKNPTRDPTAC